MATRPNVIAAISAQQREKNRKQKLFPTEAGNAARRSAWISHAVPINSSRRSRETNNEELQP